MNKMGERISVGNLTSLDTLLKELKTEAKGYEDFQLNDPKSLKLECSNAVQGLSYKAVVAGKELSLLPSAQTTLCRLLGMDEDYFKKYPDKAEFAEHVNKLLSRRGKGVLLRVLNGKELRAVLPSHFTILDDDNFFENF